jgi:serine protease Do
MTAVMEELAQVAARAADEAVPSVVRIGRDGRGAGFVMADGLVATSAHNLRGAEATVTFADGRSATGEVKGVDPDGDLAVLAVDTSGLRPLEWRRGPDAASVSLGEVVLVPALAAAGTARVTWGTVSSVGTAFRGPQGRLISDAFEHTAPVGRGWSGGPVLDTAGRVVGVDTHRPGEAFYLARPLTAEVAARLEALARGESPARRRIGIAVAPPHVARRLRAAVGLPERDGLLVREVAEGTPAQAAGLQRGDLIVSAGGQPVATMDGLLAAVEAVGGDGRLSLGLLRGAEELTVELSFD